MARSFTWNLARTAHSHGARSSLYNDPSTHRMHWVKTETSIPSIVKPLRGRGSKDGEGPGLRVLAYDRPSDVRSPWEYETVCDFLHLSHNFHPVNWDDDPEEELIVAAKEGVWHFDKRSSGWESKQLTGGWAGEIRDGRLPGGETLYCHDRADAWFDVRCLCRAGR